VLDFYDRGEFPSVKKNNICAQAQNGIPRLKFFNFKNTEAFSIQIQKKTNDGRKFLMERSDIVAAR
jgi:hypothetical protein